MMKKIMILEDDEATAELIKFYLQEEGFQVTVSARGNGFIARVTEYQPDFITLDILLPDADGFSIFKELQADARTKKYPGHIYYSLGWRERKRNHDGSKWLYRQTIQRKGTEKHHKIYPG